MLVGLPQRPETAGNGGRVRGMPRLPSMRGDQRRLLAADEGAGALLDLEREVPAAAEDVVAEEAALLGGRDGDAEALDGQRVLGAHVDVALVRADGVARR